MGRADLGRVGGLRHRHLGGLGRRDPDLDGRGDDDRPEASLPPDLHPRERRGHRRDVRDAAQRRVGEDDLGHVQAARQVKTLWFALAVAAAARALPLFLGYEHYGDAPVRIELAEAWARAPHLWRGVSDTYQYGPLHLTLLGALGRLLGDRVAGARLLSFFCRLFCVT